MNLSPAGVLCLPGVPGPSRPGLRLQTLEGDLDPSLDGDLLGVLDGVFFVSDSLSLFRPDPPPPSRDPLRPEQEILNLKIVSDCLSKDIRITNTQLFLNYEVSKN